jgi:hypothetical protein
MTGYTQQIRETLAKLGHIGVNPRHVEGWMRLQHGCLDGLSTSQFRAEVKIALECIAASTPEQNESLAQSEGC